MNKPRKKVTWLVGKPSSVLTSSPTPALNVLLVAIFPSRLRGFRASDAAQESDTHFEICIVHRSTVKVRVNFSTSSFSSTIKLLTFLQCCIVTKPLLSWFPYKCCRVLQRKFIDCDDFRKSSRTWGNGIGMLKWIEKPSYICQNVQEIQIFSSPKREKEKVLWFTDRGPCNW